MTTVELGTTESDVAVLRDKGFILEAKVGQGSYAKVFKATHIIDETHHVTVACKIIDTAQAPRDYLTKFMPRELDVLIRIEHPHIINVSSIFQRRAKYFVFLRLAENGDLLDFLSTHGAIPENQARLWMRQLISAVHYLHTLNIAHRDLKCENVLITTNYNVKLTDFGFARNTKYRNKDILSETYCGSLSYACPEILKGTPYLPKQADMWSLGIIMYTMLNKALPFNETSVKKLYEKQLMKKWRFRSGIVNLLSDECKELVTKLMNPEPKGRPTAGAVFLGAWIAMNPEITKESLLKAAQENTGFEHKGPEDENEQERIAELRRKGRVKEGLRVLKISKATDVKSEPLISLDTKPHKNS